MVKSEVTANLRGDVFGGLTAAVVALPLALAFGVASGAGPIAGLYGAVMTGLFAALFGGTPTQISGPTGPMTVVMAGILTLFVGRHPENGPALAFTTVMIGGVIQIVLGRLKWGRFINLVPYTVVSGFMSGIGVIIILLQLAPFLGSAIEPGSPAAVLQHAAGIVTEAKPHTLMLSVPLLMLLFLWPRRLTQMLPSPLLVLIGGTIAAQTLFAPGAIATLGEVPSGWPSMQWPTVSADVLIDMLKYGAVLGLLGSIDSLLTSLVADSMTRTEHDPDRELTGQGIGNLMAGLFGGLPGAGATMRTVVNIRAGGRSKWSGVVHAVTLASIALIGGRWVAAVPEPALAAILLKVGVDIIDWRFLRRLFGAPLESIVITLAVLVLTVTVDLITAVAVGVVMSCVYTVNRLTHQQLSRVKALFGKDSSVHLEPDEYAALETVSDRVVIYCLSGPFSFGAAKGLAKGLNAFRDYDILLLDLTDVPYIDTSTALAIGDIIRSARSYRRRVIVACSNADVRQTLRRLGVVELLGAHKLFSNRLDAIGKARELYLSIHAAGGNPPDDRSHTTP